MGDQTRDYSPSIISHEQLLKTFDDLGFLTSDDLRRFEEPDDESPRDAQSLIRNLVEKKKLTRFQTSMIWEGKAGDLVLGEYVLLDKIGAGGMGMVYKAQHRRMKRLVALKVLPSDIAKSPDKIKRFQREVEAAARLTHPNIVTAFDASEQSGVHYLVMELVEGSDLQYIVKQKDPIPLAKVVKFILQAANGLEYAHSKGIIHRDVKPSNLLLDSDGIVKILDMGLARFEDPLSVEEGVEDTDSPDTLTRTGTIMGTVDFMSPEQALDSKTADHRSDIYGLGCSFYYLLTRKPLYEAGTLMQKLLAHREGPPPSLKESLPDIPESIDAIYLKMVAPRVEDRYQTMSEVQNDLGALILEDDPNFEISSLLEKDSSKEDDPTLWLENIFQTQMVFEQHSSASRDVIPETQTYVPTEREFDRTTTWEAEEEVPEKTGMISWIVGAAATVSITVAIFFLVSSRNQDEAMVPEFPPRTTSTLGTVEKPKSPPVGEPEDTGTKVEEPPPISQPETENAKAGAIPTVSAVAKVEEPPPLVEEVMPAQPPAVAVVPFNEDEATEFRKKWAEYVKQSEVISNSVGMKMILIPPGQFVMGTDKMELQKLQRGQRGGKFFEDWFEIFESEGPQHWVRITKPFYMSVTEVTINQFRTFVKATGYLTTAEKKEMKTFGLQNDKWIVGSDYSWQNLGEFVSDDLHPVMNVSWTDAATFCDWLSNKRGEEGKKYRLPSEAQWEYACRAGSMAKWSNSNDELTLKFFAWFLRNAGNRVQPVARKYPNSFGLCDMHGNVWEWCADWYGNSYYESSPPNEPMVDPSGPAAGDTRVLRGGSVFEHPLFGRSSSRNRRDPSYSLGVGFRVEMTYEED